MSESSSDASFLSHQESSVATAQRHTAQLARLLSTESGKALVQHYLAASPPTTAMRAQRQTAQLAALTSSAQGKALLQQTLTSFIERRQQRRQLEQQEAAGSAPGSPVATPAGSKRVRAAFEEVPAAQQAGDDAAKTLMGLHPKVLATAVAVSRTPTGSAERAAGLAQLKRDLMAHSSLSTALALATSPTQTAAALTAAVTEADLPGKSFQEQEQPGTPPAAPCSSSSCQAASPGEVSHADAEGTCCPLPWQLLQGMQQAAAEDRSLAAAAAAAGVFAAPLSHVGSGAAALRTASLEPSSAVSGGRLGRTASQVLVFKRRSANSAALRKHFSVSSQKQAAATGRQGEAAGLLRPQNQLFKNQRKKPLMLWSSSSSTQQQLQAYKAQATQPNSQAAPEQLQPEASQNQTSSSGMDASAFTGSFTATRGTAAAAASAAAAARAPAAMAAAGVESVLCTLVRQEQQLLKLQQQLRQQRQLMDERRQQQKRQRVESASGPVSAPAAPREESGQAVHPGALPPTDMPALTAPAQQQKQPAVAPAEAIAALMAIANAMSAQQQQAVSSKPACGWSDDVVRKLTTALLAA